MKKVTDWFYEFMDRLDYRNRNEVNSNPYLNAFSIKKIFIDNWDSFCKQPDVIKNGIRPCVQKEVIKMMGCYDFKNGFSLFECPNCHKFTRVPFTCKSRFCNKCGVIYARNRANAIAKKTLDVRHRHAVFTIDAEFRYYFKKDRALLGCLFKAVEETLFFAFKKCGRKSENLTPGFIMVLHTFGRDLKWNPHVHVLVTEGGMTEQGVYKQINYIHFEQLRKSFMKCFFDQLALHMDVFEDKDTFYHLKKMSYRNHEHGFYVHAPSRKSHDNNQKGQKQVINYVLRYAGRPVMAQRRIEGYDPNTKLIQYWYEPHDSKEVVHITEHVFHFIAKLIQHIQESNFKTIRHAGIYAANDKKYKEKKVRYAQKQSFQNFIHHFRSTIIQDFKRDPLRCPCGTTMEFVEIFILS